MNTGNKWEFNSEELDGSSVVYRLSRASSNGQFDYGSNKPKISPPQLFEDFSYTKNSDSWDGISCFIEEKLPRFFPFQVLFLNHKKQSLCSLKIDDIRKHSEEFNFESGVLIDPNKDDPIKFRGASHGLIRLSYMPKSKSNAEFKLYRKNLLNDVDIICEKRNNLVDKIKIVSFLLIKREFSFLIFWLKIK